MHAIRLQCHRFNFHRNFTGLLEKYVKTSIKSGCLNYTTTDPNLNEAEQFKAAVLHPKKQNLTVETLVLPEKAADGMV